MEVQVLIVDSKFRACAFLDMQLSNSESVSSDYGDKTTARRNPRGFICISLQRMQF